MPVIIPSTVESLDSAHAAGTMYVSIMPRYVRADDSHRTYRQLKDADLDTEPTPTSTRISGTGGHHVESVALSAACGLIASGLFILVSHSIFLPSLYFWRLHCLIDFVFGLGSRSYSYFFVAEHITLSAAHTNTSPGCNVRTDGETQTGICRFRWNSRLHP